MVFFRFQIKDDIKAARIEATKAYRSYVEEPKTSQQRCRFDLELELSATIGKADLPPQIQLIHLIPGPGGPPQKLQTGPNAGVMGKTSDIDLFSQFHPTIVIDQFGQHHFQGDAVQSFVTLLFSH
jgi:hypothetical protein